MSPYESPKLLSEYLLLHYGGEEATLGGLPGPLGALHFPQRCVTELLEPAILPANASALDVGCAVGASSFHLARHCARVIGIDYSTNFIAAAQQLAKTGSHPFRRAIEGERFDERTALVPAGIDRSRVRFEIGDATALRPDLGSYDLVLAANLICRLPDPAAFLSRLSELVKPDGQLLLTTPFTWLDEFTPRDRWLGAQSPHAPSSMDVLRDRLTPHFDLQHTANLPFLIREHARKFQYGVALGTRWVRTSTTAL